MVDQGKLEASDVPIQTNRPRLFFHGTQIPHAPQLLHEYGLMADRPTLSPTLEIAGDYVGPMGGGFLTFWYPKPSEVSKKNYRRLRLTTPLPEELRQRALREISESDLDKSFKNAYSEIIKKAQTYLPASRLGAVTELKPFEILDLAFLLSPLDPKEIIRIYTMMKTALADDLLGILEKMNIVFFFPDLDRPQLAQDMIKTSVDHALLSISHHIQVDLNSLSKKEPVGELAKQIHRNNLEFLERVSFEEERYERYRKFLIAGIQKILT